MPAATHAGSGAVGSFPFHTDVGPPNRAGAATYDPAGQVYRIAGSGSELRGPHDAFHYVWKRLSGDFILYARAGFEGGGAERHRQLGWMVRSTLAPGSAHVSAAVNGAGMAALRLRRLANATTEEVRATFETADVIKLERSGDCYTMSVARFGEPWVTIGTEALSIGDGVHAGLFVCSGDPELTAEAVFRDVRVTVPAAEGLVPYQDHLGSRLESLNVDTGDRRVLFRTAAGIEAPNWTPDGSALIYNSQGRLFRFLLADGRPEMIDTGFADRNNNDHVLSFDGQTMGISHHSEESGGASVIYTLPAAGGEPRRVTDNAPSYLHGWSPDGKFLVYTGERNGDYDIYRIGVNGGDEVRLTSGPRLDDGPEYSPDGNFIYFNSARTGTMQIWRMRPDGSDQTQLTDDALNDWFPHVSPDGQRIVFLSFPAEVPAEEHPYYQHVYLRMLNLKAARPKVVAYLYGGQGTINVASWSPDSRHLAFISHTGA